MACCKKCKYWKQDAKMQAAGGLWYYAECVFPVTLPESLSQCEQEDMFCWEGANCPCFQKYEGE
jgi:hypothetical protein